ncbi:hypothetical protein EMGBS12_11740 [Methylophilaceae bacterium]|nr:hypothetical protein EMGBS12_11740 [Methylophilaceae bacterium]
MYTINSIISQLRKTLTGYLEADYHILDESLVSERKYLLENNRTIENEARLEGGKTYKTGLSYEKMNIPINVKDMLLELSRIQGSGIFNPPRLHQQIAIEKFITNQDDLIISTGTGSGKTETFLYPIIGASSQEKERGQEVLSMPGVRTLILYPMNALVNDQLTRLRQILGNEESKKIFKKHRGKVLTFGIYTSKTEYPGLATAEKNNVLLNKLKSKYINFTKSIYEHDKSKAKQKLIDNNLYPKKNIEGFINSGLVTQQDDSELITRHEILKNAPDFLITNYSMLEYMLLRPVERNIFKQTTEWLKAHADNKLTIVLDEAHTYRGVLGGEISFLLKRLYARLEVPREKIRIIIASASLGEDDAAKDFAKKLTGHSKKSDFYKINDEADPKPENKISNKELELKALETFNIKTIENAHSDLNTATQALSKLFESMQLGPISLNLLTLEELQSHVFEKLNLSYLGTKLYNDLIKETMSVSDVTEKIFSNNSIAFDSLISIVTFAKKNGTYFLPIKLHLMYRGVPGIYACINPTCSEKGHKTENSLLGKLYSTPEISCKCGGRVFELFTHRECGAAYIRGYLPSSAKSIIPDNGILLHEQAYFPSNESLSEVDLLVDMNKISISDFNRYYLHIYTGKIVHHDPSSSEYIRVAAGDIMQDETNTKKELLSFKKCPVCQTAPREGLKIMDLATKGEAPFSYLIHKLVSSQPPSKALKEDGNFFPARGRKAVIFADGRQKAARLAKNIPEASQRDAFRICLILALKLIEKNSEEQPSIKLYWVYFHFLKVIKQKNILFFAGQDREDLVRALEKVDEIDYEDIREDKEFREPPVVFRTAYLRSFMDLYYSLKALTIGDIKPTKNEFNKWLIAVKDKYPDIHLSDEVLYSIVQNRLSYICTRQKGLGDAYARKIREDSLPYTKKQKGNSFGIKEGEGIRAFYKPTKNYIAELNEDQCKEIDKLIFKIFLAPGKDDSRDYFFIKERTVFFEFNYDKNWNYCESCKKLSLNLISEKCPHCGSTKIKVTDPNDEYLKARKGFYKDLIIEEIDKFNNNNNEENTLLNLSAAEHTAQLSMKDQYTLDTTNEISERRFKDLLLNKGDYPYDLLCCTTTMEVGVDIGSLIAVGMRNVPPERQNYQQRAGRAGRRGASVSTVLTFAQNGSHDSYYYDRPDLIISGVVPEPNIDNQNPKISQRHIWANIIQNFFHDKDLIIEIENESEIKKNDLMSILGHTKDFYSSEGKFSISALREWIKINSFNTDIPEYLDWIKTLNLNTKPFEELVDKLIEIKPKDLDDENSYDESLLDFLFSNDILPSYAFPRQMCSFPIEDKTNSYVQNLIEKPQQSLATAISEYAPGRLVEVKQVTYKITGIASTENQIKPPAEDSSNTLIDYDFRAKDLFKNLKTYLHCHNCLNTQVINNDNHSCSQCGHETLSELKVVQPSVVYGEQSESEDEDDYSGSSQAQLLIKNIDEGIFSTLQSNGNVRLIILNDQDLISINKGPDDEGFSVCKLCGLSNASGKHDKPYKSRMKKCIGQFEVVNLGYQFKSDIFLMRVTVPDSFNFDTNNIHRDGLITAAKTFSESLLQATARKLDVNLNEMSSGVRFIKGIKQNYIDIYIYDTSSGGSGYAKQIGLFPNGRLQEAKSDFLESTCCESSCYKCLQNYSNRMSHNKLDKKFGLQLWNLIYKNESPKFYNVNEQFDLATTLIKLAQLDGYEIVKSNECLKITKNTKSLNLMIFPIFYDESSLKEDFSNIALFISDYELIKSLTSAFNKMSSLYYGQ